MDARPALFRALPQLQRRVPWTPLGKFPTPVERVDGLAPPSVELWVKRDDLSGVEYGGNKVRKLEFLLAEARAGGAKRLCTLGGIGSHHVLATAIYGRREGFDVEAVVFPQPVTEHVREQLLADAAAGARLAPTGGYLGVPLAVWRRRRRGTAWIAAGGSSVTGTLGYVSAGCELVEQVRSGELPRPDLIYVALGSGGTAAGLLIGLAALDVELVAVRVVDRVVANAGKTRRLAARTFAFLRAGAADGVTPQAMVKPIGDASGAAAGGGLDASGAAAAGDGASILADGARGRLRVEHQFFGGAYGRATAEAEAAVRDAAAAGLRLEATYTGKAMAALLADARAGRLDGKRVLFLHSYNGVDLAPLLARGPGPSALPPRLRKLFDGA